MKSVIDILQSKLVKREYPLNPLSTARLNRQLSSTVRQVIKLQQGIVQEKAKEIAKIIKDSKMKVQAEIQKDQLRVRAKKLTTCN